MTNQLLGRPKYDSRQKLIAAMRELLSERGYSATSPKMNPQASLRVFQRVSTSKALEAGAFELDTQHSNPALAAKTEPYVDVKQALHELVRRREGQALVRLLADPASAELPRLRAAVHWWADSLRAQLAASHHNADTTHPVLAMALGEALLALGKREQI